MRLVHSFLDNRKLSIAVAWIGATWVAFLIALQRIPHTGALRTLFLVIGIVHLLTLIRLAGRVAWPVGGRECLLFFLLTIWLIAQCAFVAPDPSAIFGLWKEWSRVILMLGMGVLVVLYGGQSAGRVYWPVVGVFMGYFGHVLLTLGYQTWSILSHGMPIVGQSLAGNYGHISPYVTGALALLVAEAVGRTRGIRWLPVSKVTLVLTIAATLGAQLLLASKSALVAALLLFVIAAAVVFSTHRMRAIMFLLLSSLILVSATLLVTNRWQGAVEAVAAATHGDEEHSTFLGSDDPLAPVNRLDYSFYARAAWAQIGIEGILAHPLGLGFGFDAFGRYVVERGGPPGAVSSHSGWIDFALANGIPGLVLMLLLLASLMHRGWKAFQKGNPAGLPTVFFTAQYFLRTSFLDDLLGESRLLAFAFTAAILWALTATPRATADG